MILNGVLVSYSKDFCQLHRTDIVNKVIAATTKLLVKQLVDVCVSVCACVCTYSHTQGPGVQELATITKQ